MRRALSGGYGGFLCQVEMKKLHLTSNEVACVHEQVANADCECPFYSLSYTLNTVYLSNRPVKDRSVSIYSTLYVYSSVSLSVSVSVSSTLNSVPVCPAVLLNLSTLIEDVSSVTPVLFIIALLIILTVSDGS